MKVSNLLTLAMIGMVGCSSMERRFLDSSNHENKPPLWVKDLDVRSEDETKVQLKVTHTIRGDQRLNACFDMARLDLSEELLKEVAENLRGALDNAETHISEEAEVVLGKVRSSDYSGQLSGVIVKSRYFERYQIKDAERIDCHLLGEISKSDYRKLKQRIIDKLSQVDSKIKEAIAKKQVDFFKDDSKRQITTVSETKTETAEAESKQESPEDSDKE